MLELKSKALWARFSPLGAKIVSLFVGDVDVVVGPGSDADSLASDAYTGAVTGRCAGRITGAKFMLDGAEVRLVANVGPDQLHGGPKNFLIRFGRPAKFQMACASYCIRPMAIRAIRGPWMSAPPIN